MIADIGSASQMFSRNNKYWIFSVSNSWITLVPFAFLVFPGCVKLFFLWGKSYSLLQCTHQPNGKVLSLNHAFTAQVCYRITKFRSRTFRTSCDSLSRTIDSSRFACTLSDSSFLYYLWFTSITWNNSLYLHGRMLRF